MVDEVLREPVSIHEVPEGLGVARLFVGEQFDRRAVPVDWHRAGFDDGAWMPVVEVGRDVAVLTPFAGEPIRRVREMPAVGVVASPEGAIVDFGQVLVGRVRRSCHSWPDAGAGSLATTHVVVSVPSAAVRSVRPSRLAKRGSDVWTPGVAAHPGCVAATSTPTAPQRSASTGSSSI